MSIQLPSITTVEGVVARLLIAENNTPDFPQYSEALARVSMNAMKAVVDNRLHNSPSQFGAPDAVDYIDIITVPGQFYGFSRDEDGNVVIAPPVQQRIDEVLKVANTGAPGKYFQFVKDAITVANGSVIDPFAALTTVKGVQVTGGGYGWRSVALTSNPGGRFIPIPATLGGIIQGNKFYTLKK
jgi:hypothetical protein